MRANRGQKTGNNGLEHRTPTTPRTSLTFTYVVVGFSPCQSSTFAALLASAFVESCVAPKVSPFWLSSNGFPSLPFTTPFQCPPAVFPLFFTSLPIVPSKPLSLCCSASCCC